MEDLRDEAANYAGWYTGHNYFFHEVLICTSSPRVELPRDKFPEHWGEYSANMVGILGTTTFVKNLRRVKQVVEEARRAGQRVVNILCLCRKGRHRSVSTARLVAYALEGKGYNLKCTEHICAVSWGNFLCRSCDSCRSTCSLKVAIYEGANQIWDALR